MTHHEVEKYRKPVRVLHWVHTGAFVLLFLTGLVLFIPQLGFLAQDSWTRLIHRIAAAVFVIAPVMMFGFGLRQPDLMEYGITFVPTHLVCIGIGAVFYVLLFLVDFVPDIIKGGRQISI